MSRAALLRLLVLDGSPLAFPGFSCAVAQSIRERSALGAAMLAHLGCGCGLEDRRG